MGEVELITRPVRALSGRAIASHIREVPLMRSEAPQAAVKPAVREAVLIRPEVRQAALVRKASSSQWAALRVMNAVGRKGQAGRMREFLGGKGWARVSVGDAFRQRQYSVILYPAGAEVSARALARHLPFSAPLLSSASATRVVLVLGRNSALFDNRLRVRKGRA